MPQLSQRSKAKISTCHDDLIKWTCALIEIIDFTVLCGHRDQLAQEEAFRLNHTTKRWPYSPHNKKPSLAIDLAPYPVNWYDKARFAFFAGYAIRKAEELGLCLRWGGDWNRNTFTNDERLVDMPHFELILNQPNLNHKTGITAA